MTACNSIANMPKKTTPAPSPTPESRAFKAALDSCGMTQAAYSEALGVSSSLVAQWASGHRPIPAKRAQRAGELAGIDPRAISASYREVSESSGGNVVPIRRGQPIDERDSSLAIARLENDVHALNLAVGALAAAMVSHRPAEARDVAALIRRKAPAKFRDQGYLGALIAMLEKAGKP